MCEETSNITVKKGPCGYISVNFGLGTFHLPKSIALALCDQLMQSLHPKIKDNNGNVVIQADQNEAA